MIRIESASLPVATYSKFQPQSTEFLDITNPKAVLENALRNFACLTAGDVIAISYNQHVYEVCVLETKPGEAVSIIECDMNVEFTAPVGYKEEERFPEENSTSDDSQSMNQDADGQFEEAIRFPGDGHRLDGKQPPLSSSNGKLTARSRPIRGVPAYDHEIGTIRFIRTLKPSAPVSSTETNPVQFEAFGGAGQSLYKKPDTKK